MNRLGGSIVGLAALVSIPVAGGGDRAEAVNRALDLHRAAIMATPGVTGAGIGNCGKSPCIKIFAEHSGQTLQNRLGELLDATPFVIVTTDPFRARPE